LNAGKLVRGSSIKQVRLNLFDGVYGFAIDGSGFRSMISGTMKPPMRLNRFLVVLIVFALFTPAEAQQVKKVPRIGFLSAVSPYTISARVVKESCSRNRFPLLRIANIWPDT
jgi:hypothetical protein